MQIILNARLFVNIFSGIEEVMRKWCRKEDLHHGPLPRSAPEGYLPLVDHHRVLYNGQPQACGAAAGLYGKKAVKQPGGLDLTNLGGPVGKLDGPLAVQR